MAMIGNRNTVAIETSWRNKEFQTAAEATCAEIVLWLGNDAIWKDTDSKEAVPVELDLVDLLEFLASNWNWILYEQSYPIGLYMDLPSEIDESLRQRVSALSEQELAEYEERVFEYKESHDLSRAFSGVYIPEVYFHRRGNTMIIDAGLNNVHIDINEAKSFLTELGDFVCSRIDNLKDKRAILVILNWKNIKREEKSENKIISSLGFRETLVKELMADVDDWYEFFEVSNDLPETEILVAARMLRPVDSAKIISRLIAKIRELPANQLDRLNKIHQGFSNLKKERFFDRPPYEQAYEIAATFRTQFRIIDYFDVEKFLKEFGVVIQDEDFEAFDIDAISCWGRHHGPAILINTGAVRAGSVPGGRRSTLAHELCHLIFDRGSMLPVAEVLGGDAPYQIEQRAEAFAAEVLLPRSQAKSMFRESKSLSEAMTAITNKYQVSYHLTALQLLNANQQFTATDREKLEKIAKISHR